MIREVVGLDHHDLVARHDGGTHGEEERPLGARRHDELGARGDGSTGKLRELAREILTEAHAAAVLGICLRSALLEARHEQVERAGDGREGVNVAVGEVHARAFQALTDDAIGNAVSVHFLAGCRVDA